jgi:hypothetical protein
MPKAAIDEDGNSLGGKDDVRSAPQAFLWTRVLAKAQAVCVKR